MGRSPGYVQPLNAGGWGGGDLVFQIDGMNFGRITAIQLQRMTRSTNASRRGPFAGTRLATS